MAITNKTGKQYYASQKKSDLKDSNALYDNQVKSTNKDYDTQVFEQGRAYEDQYRENAVQKEINKRQVAESMANLGLTDSGLNRTQQTAVQLSYGNNKANIDRQRQAGIDSLNYSRRQALDTIEQNRLATNTQIKQDYASKAAVYDENRKTEAKSLVLSYLELGAEPPKDMIALSGMTDSELKGYRNYYKKAIAAAKAASSSKQNNSSGDDKKEPKAYKLTTTEAKEIENIFNNNGKGEDAYKKVINYLKLIGKEPSKTDELNIQSVLGYNRNVGWNTYDENDYAKNGDYDLVMADLRKMKAAGKSNTEAYNLLKECLGNGVITQSQYISLYQNYRNNTLS